MKKQLVLWLIVTSELILAFYFGVKIWQYFLSRFKGEQNNIVTTIPSAKTLPVNDGELQYYYQFKPGSWEEEPEWLPYSVTYHINDDSLREFKNYSVDKPDDTFRIIALGDSFTYGHPTVKTHKMIADRVATYLMAEVLTCVQ